MEIKHTPGPWFAATNEYYFDIKLEPGFFGQTFASVHRNSVLKIGTQTAEANANLIAAAPELLEALTEVLSYIDKKIWWNDKIKQEAAFVKANSAITKATGGQI